MKENIKILLKIISSSVLAIAGFILFFTLLFFKPYYKAIYNDNLIGYYKTIEDYNKIYNEVINQDSQENLKVNAFILNNNDEIFGINSKTHLAEATQILNKRILQKHLDNGVTIVDPNTTWISPETEIEADTLTLYGYTKTDCKEINNEQKILANHLTFFFIYYPPEIK